MPSPEATPAPPRPHPLFGEKVGEEDGDAVGDEDEEELVLMSGAAADDGDVIVSDGRNMEDFLDEDEIAAWEAGGEAATTLEA